MGQDIQAGVLQRSQVAAPPGSGPHRDGGWRFRLLERVAVVSRRRRIPGLRRLLNVFYNPFRRRHDHFSVVIEHVDGFWIHIDTAILLEWHLYFFGHYERWLEDALRRILRPGSVAVDVGANIGYYTLRMASLVGEGGNVFALEPNPKAYGRLLENLNINRFRNVRPFPMALSDSHGVFKLHSYGGADGDLVSTFHEGNLQSPRKAVPVADRGIHSYDVEGTTLDELLGPREVPRLDLVKVDVEGHELRVLRGAEGTLRAYRPHVIFEYNRRAWSNAGSELSDARRILAGLGYTLYRLGDGHHAPLEDEAPGFANILAIPAVRP
ncbi:MAG: FkbM family methyltransferase [Planctomycetes bacterium]|nr:FkbM family methyltransferase [Planctomycetota bacterium]